MMPIAAVVQGSANSDLLLQSFEVMAEAPGGVKRLRELILQLAVRGKLMPQNPEDESAGVLIEQIRQQQPHSRKGRTVLNSKANRSIVPSDVPFGVPDSWEWVRLGEIGQIVGGGTPRSTVSRYWADDGIPWLTPADLRGHAGKYIERGKRDLSREGLEASSARLLPEGAVLFSSRAPIGYVAIAAQPVATNQGFKSCVPYIREISEYIYWFLRAVGPEVDRNAPGTTFREVSGKIVSQILVPLPPLAEQRRIVSKVDQLMSLCNELEERQRRRRAQQARLNRTALHRITSAGDDSDVKDHWRRVRENFDELFDAPDTVTELRQAILQLAVRGRLVSQDPSDEPAPALLERIEAEKLRMSKAGTIRNPRSLPPLQDSEARLVLPEGWAWARLGMIANHRLGKMLDKQKNSGDLYPYLRNTNVQWKRFDLQDVKEIRLEPHELEEYRVRKGDLLVCEGGEPGRCAVWAAEGEEMFFQKALHRVRPYGDIEPWYLLYHIQSDALDGTLSSYFTGATIKHMTGQALSRYALALPPVAEQRRIVERVKHLTALCDEVEAQLTRSKTKAERLAGAIVHHLTAA